jgi:hypothetical protein
MTVGHLLRSITARELAEWAAYFKLENERLEGKGGGQTKPKGDVDSSLKAALKKMGKASGGKRR